LRQRWAIPQMSAPQHKTSITGWGPTSVNTCVGRRWAIAQARWGSDRTTFGVRNLWSQNHCMYGLTATALVIVKYEAPKVATQAPPAASRNGHAPRVDFNFHASARPHPARTKRAGVENSSARLPAMITPAQRRPLGASSTRSVSKASPAAMTASVSYGLAEMLYRMRMGERAVKRAAASAPTGLRSFRATSQTRYGRAAPASTGTSRSANSFRPPIAVAARRTQRNPSGAVWSNASGCARPRKERDAMLYDSIASSIVRDGSSAKGTRRKAAPATIASTTHRLVCSLSGEGVTPRT